MVEDDYSKWVEFWWLRCQLIGIIFKSSSLLSLIGIVSRIVVGGFNLLGLCEDFHIPGCCSVRGRGNMGIIWWCKPQSRWEYWDLIKSMEILYTTPTHYFKYGIILRNPCQNGASLTIRKSHLSDCPPKNVEDQEDLGQLPHLGKHWRVRWTSILISLPHSAMLSWSRGGLIGAVITKSITNGEHQLLPTFSQFHHQGFFTQGWLQNSGFIGPLKSHSKNFWSAELGLVILLMCRWCL